MLTWIALAALALNATGAQTVSVREYQSGLWKVRVQWSSQGQDNYFEKPLIISPSHS